jgi:LAO/AO transport system kinase
MVDIIDEMGKYLIIVETVGVGQDEVDIIRLEHVHVVIHMLEMGDGSQAIKAGILEF